MEIFLYVMPRDVRAILGLSNRYVHQNGQSAPFIHCVGRCLSTRSAIDKGLRKSRHGRSRFDPPARLGGVPKRDDSGRQPSHYRSRAPNLERQSALSNDDEGPTARNGSFISRRRRLLRADNSQIMRSQHKIPSEDFGRPQLASSRTPFPPPSSKPSGKVVLKAAAPLNRAQRRAATFGHNDNPPDGYKALPIVSTKQQSWSHQHRDGDWTVRASHTRSRHEVEYEQESATKKSDEGRWIKMPHRGEGGGDLDGNTASFAERPRRKSHAPLAIPYTTPASEFLYGHSVVTAALKGSRRKFYKIYLYQGDSAEVRGQDSQVRKLALAANVEVTRVGSDWLRLMDKMSGGRPHNGYILEASPLPKIPVTSLDPVPSPQASFRVAMGHQSKEEEAVNGSNSVVRYGTGYRRYPFLLLLDGIRDPGNMGAIFRSAHFLGADGIVICNHNSAGLTPVTLKAAAGAAESLPIFSVDRPTSFIDSCRQNGWKFYAAVSPSSSDSEHAARRPFFLTSTMGNPTQTHPCILILGSEGEGLQWNIQKKADYSLGIEAQRIGNGDLDSLNVSVAAALLCQAFLKKPTADNGLNPDHKAISNDTSVYSRRNEDGRPGFVGEEFEDPGTAAAGQRLF